MTEVLRNKNGELLYVHLGDNRVIVEVIIEDYAGFRVREYLPPHEEVSYPRELFEKFYRPATIDDIKGLNVNHILDPAQGEDDRSPSMEPA